MMWVISFDTLIKKVYTFQVCCDMINVKEQQNMKMKYHDISKQNIVTAYRLGMITFSQALEKLKLLEEGK